MMEKNYIHAASHQQFLTLRLGDLVNYAEERWAAKTAVVFPFQGITKTFKEVKNDVTKVAAGLASMNLNAGDRVVYFSLTCYESYIFVLSAWQLGLIVAFANTALQAQELRQLLKLTEPAGILVGQAYKGHEFLGVVNAAVKQLAGELDGQGKKCSLHVITTNDKEGCSFSIEKWLKFENTSFVVTSSHTFDDVSTILFTSGTTGVPKGVTFLHHSLVNNGFFTAKALGISEKDIICSPVPLYHGLGAQFALVIPFLTGATIIFPCFGYNPTEIQTRLVGTNILVGSPTILYDVAQAGGSANLTKLIYAGAACTTTHSESFKEKFPNAALSCLYGVSEAGMIFADGRVLDHTEAKTDKNGELFVRGYNITKGYWKDPERTRKAKDEADWLRTGDICRLGEKCEFIGRAVEQINRGGVKINPGEVEALIYQMKEVAEVHVFGVASPRLGEEVAAWVKLKEGSTLMGEGVKEFCKGKIAHFKVPSYVKIVSEFPRTAIGKVKKNVMAEAMMELLK